MTLERSWLPVLTVALLAFGGGPAWAGPKDGPGSRINQMLMALHAEYAAHGAQPSGARYAAANRLVRVVDDRVVIDAVADGDVGALQAALAALGMRDMAVFGRVVSGQLPISAIPTLRGVADLRFARPSVFARHVGIVTSQGDRAMRADIARATFGVSGAGVKVGVLSDSFNCKGGAAADVASGDLPATVEVIQEGSCAGDNDEGRAMLQIVHDVAPGAALAFATADGGQANFANNIRRLRANGAKVIVDDILYFAEPMFQDGIIAQAADSVVRQGAAYFSSAGNSARQSYENAFRAGAAFAQEAFPSVLGAPRFFGGVAHDFAPTGTPDHFQRITMPAFSQLIITFQWDSPFLSAGGAGSPNDLDIYLFNAAGTTVLDGAATDNVGGDALEVFSFTNFGPTADFNIMIVSFSPPPPAPALPLPGYIKYVQLGSPTIITRDFDTASSTLFGHANATFAAAVGAAKFDNTPAFGVDPPVLESFSSGGVTPIFFDTAGNRFASRVLRQKPEIVAPDGVSTTVPGFSPFFGTSAAAPHAAGVAALMLEKSPVLAPVTVYAALEKTAINMGPPSLTAINMGPPGFDVDSGFGLIQADGAVSLVSTLQAEAAAVLPSSRSVTVGSPATAFATVLNAGPGTAVNVGISVARVGISAASPLLGTFSYQTTDPLTNAPTGSPNTPVDIQAGGSQTYVVSITPSSAFAASDIQFFFAGANTFPTPPLTGVSTLLLAASNSPVPDVVALAATLTPGLTAVIPGNNGATAFAVATVNVGVSGSVRVTADSGSLPIVVGLCQTTTGGTCVDPVSTSVTLVIGPGATPTFSFFVQGQGFVPFDPAANRIFVRLTDTATGATVGSTSVAVRTQ